MRKQLKFLLFVVALLTLVMMTMIFVSAAAADGDTEATEGFDVANYNFKVEDKDGNTVGYYINLGSSAEGTAGGAWAAVPEGGKLLLLKNVNYADKLTLWLYSGNSFTFDLQGNKIDGKPNWKLCNALGATDAATNTIKFYNGTINSGNTLFELMSAGTTFQWEKVTSTIYGYAYHVNADNMTIEFLGDENSTVSGNAIFFNILKPVTLKIEGGNFKNAPTSASKYIFFVNAASTIVIDGGTFTQDAKNGAYNDTNFFRIQKAANITINGGTFQNEANGQRSNFVHVATGKTSDTAFDVVFTVNDGSFIRGGLSTSAGDYANALFCVYGGSSAAQFNINGGYFQAPSCIFQTQNNTMAEINITNGEFYVPAKTTVKVTETVDGVSTEVEKSYTGQAIFWFYNGATFTRTIGGKAVTNSINVTGGTLNNANKGMPIIYATKNVTQGTEAAPIKISFSNVTLDACGRFMVLSAKAASYYDVTIDNVTFTQSGSRDFITAEGTATNVTLAVTDSTVKAKSLFYTKGTAVIDAEIEGGSYTITSKLFSVDSSNLSDLYIVDGSFVVPTVDALYNSMVRTWTDAGEFIVQKITADTVFDDVEGTIFGDAATMKTTYYHVLDNGTEYTFASVDDMLALNAAFIGSLPKYVTVEGVSLELDNGTKVVFTGGEYTSYTTYFFNIINGTIVATDATFNAPYGRFVYVTAADASVDLAFNNCNITSGDGYHMFQGSLPTGSVMAKFHLVITGGNYNAGDNIASFGAATDAKVVFNDGNFTAKGHIVYTGSVGEYAFLGGTYTAGSYAFNMVPTNAISGNDYSLEISNVVVNAYRLFGLSLSDATLNLNVKNVTAFLTSSAVVVDEEKSGMFNLTLENSMFVITREDGSATTFLKGLVDLVTLTLNGNVTIVTNADTTLVGDKVIDANAPAVKYAGVLYRAFFSSKTANEFAYEANLYLGSDEAQSGIRFVTALSDDVVALVAEALAAEKTVSYGMLIAPADYVMAAKAFTKAAIDAKFGSTAGVLASGKNSYVDIPAVNSKRDTNEDGVYESFSGALVNLKAENYSRAFAAVAYVVIDGEIYYSSFNTLDQARSAKAMAQALIAEGIYADDAMALDMLNKYAGVAAE